MSLTGTDSDGDTLQFSLVTGPSNGRFRLDPLTGQVRYVRNEGYVVVTNFGNYSTA